MAKTLSPLALPFLPLDKKFVIYSNGVPQMTCAGMKDVSCCIQGISDDAVLEQLYPPTAAEAAEMEAAEAFVELLADIALLEEDEIRARNSLGKRWSKKREEGLIRVKKGTVMNRNRDIVVHKLQQKMRHQVKTERMHGAIPLKVRGCSSVKPKVIQQPKKFS